MPEPVFSADEVAAVLERAAELQREGKKRSSETGLTLSELEDIAKESGIDPAHIREAAFDLVQPRPTSPDKSSSYNKQIIVERTVKAELTPELSEDIISELRTRYESSGYAGTTYGVPGGVVYGASRIEHIGRTVEWIYTDWWGYEHRVRLQPRGDQLRIRMSSPGGWARPQIESATYSMLLAIAPAIITGVVSGSLTWVLIVAALVFSVCFAAFTNGLTKGLHKKQRKTQETVDWIANCALTMAGTAESAGRIAIPEQDEFGIEDEHTHFHSSRVRT